MELGARKTFALGMLFAFLLVGCASMFGYPYYELVGMSYVDGKLLGDKPAHDMPFSVCEPRADNKNPCVVMLSEDFFRLKRDYLSLEDRLTACEQGRP